jgi:hypothetical protein
MALPSQAAGTSALATPETSVWNVAEIITVSLFVVVASATVLATAVARLNSRRRANEAAAMETRLDHAVAELGAQHGDQTSVLQREPNLAEEAIALATLNVSEWLHAAKDPVPRLAEADSHPTATSGGSPACTRPVPAV